MEIYYINIITFAFTIYIGLQIVKEIKKQIGLKKGSTMELVDEEKKIMKKVWLAISKPTKTDQKENLYHVMELVEKNYTHLVKYTMAVALAPLVIVFMLQLVMQESLLFKIGGFEVKWYTILLLLIPFMVIKVIIRIKEKRKNTQ